MPRYRITDNTSGRTLLVEGDSPPTEADAIELFAGQPAEAPPADSARAAQSAAAPVANREAEMKRRYGLGLSRAQRDARDDKSRQISAVEDTALRVGVPVAAALAAPATGGLSLLAGAAGGFTGEVMAQEREMERGVRDQASYGQMIAAPIITGTPLGPAFKGAAYVKDALVAARPAAVATRAAFGGTISGGANAISQAIDTGEVDGADVLKSAAYGALFGGVMGGVETVQTTRAMKAAILDLRQRTGDFRSTDLEFVAKMQRAAQRAPAVSPDAIVPAGGRAGAPDGPPPVVQPAAPAAGMPPFDPNVRAVDVVLPRPPPRAPVPPSAPAQVAPPEPPPAPVDNAPVGAPPPAAIESAPPVPPDKMSATQVSPVAAGSPAPGLPEPAQNPTVLEHGDPLKVPRAEIAQRPDLMQFKRVDEGASGVNAEDKLTGSWDPLKGGLLLLWEPATPAAHGLTGAQRYIVANGHHRVEFGDRVDNRNYNAQVVREADGYSASDARRLGAEINIADGKGNIYDQAKFIRNIAATHGSDEALAAGRRVGARGRKAANIGIAAGPDAFDAFINERIGADHAEQIALAAPGNDGLQRVGVGAALRGANPQEAANLVRAAASMQGGEQGAQGDLFGADDSALLAMEAQAKRATAIQNQLTEDIRAVQGAAKNPAAAKKYGVDIKDQAGLETKLAELKALRARWDNWHLEPDLVAQVRPAPVAPVPEVPPPAEAPPPQDANQIDMFGGEPPSAPPTALDQFNGSALMPAPEKLDLPVQPAPPAAPPLKRGDRFQDGSGQMFEVWRARFGVVTAHPVINGSPVVNNQSGVRFAESDVAKQRDPEARTDIVRLLPSLPESNTAIIQRLTGELGMADLGREYDRAPEIVQKLQQLGEALLPGVRIQEGERLAHLYLLSARGEATPLDVQKYKNELIKGNYVRKPAGGDKQKDDPNKPGPNDAEAGRISPDALFPLARAVLGGAFGYLEGDTPEEKLAFAMAGALGLGVLGSRRLARRVLAALKPDRTAVPSYPFDPGQPLRAIDKQGRVVGTHTMGALEHVRAIEMPELVHLARQLSGNDVLLRTFPKSHGMFRHRGEDFRIELDRRIFADPVSAQRTMAHELGHMIDYLDDKTMNRGNLLGRLAVLREHLGTTLPDTPWNPNQALQPKEREKLRRAAEKEIGKRPPQDEEADLAAWKEAVAKSYAEKVEEVIADRGLLKDQEIRAELIGVSEWWRPYEADKVSAGYIDYRNSSVELYADALSVLFNAPSELRDRAPLFFAGWMAYLDRKPEAKHALQDAWHFLHQGQIAVVAARNDRIKAGFVKAEEFLINHARERELDRTTLRGIIDQTKQEWWNIYQPIIAKGAAVKAAGVKLPWHQDPEFFFDSHALAENQNYLLLERLQRTVVNPVEASGLTRDDLGLYLLHNRILNESYLDRDGAAAGRSVLANPQGITPLQARMALLVRRVPSKHATPEQREAHRARELGLETAARTVQDAFHDLVRDGHQAGIFSDENLALSEANRYNYAPFAVVDYLLRSDRVPAGISRQLGTVKDVASPYLTFVLKGMAVAKLTELNRATTLTVDLLTRYFPGEIERAPERKVALADGSMMTLPPPPPPRGKATLTLLRKGKREAYYVDPSYAKMFDDQMPASAHVIAKVLNYTMRNFFHPLFITYNPGFVYAANPMSDTLRSYYALPPGTKRRKWIAENRAAWETARARVAQDVTVQDMPRKRALVALRKQRPLTPTEAVELKVLEARALAFEAVATRALASPADSFAQTGGNTDDLWGRMLRDHSLISDEPGRFLKLAQTYLPHIVKTAKMVERHGMMSEALPKLAAYNMIGKVEGWSKEEVAFYVRNNIGTPNTYKRGSRAVVNGSFLPYINVFTRGMESDLAVARGKVVGPESRGRKAAEFWRRMTESSFVPSLLQALAMVGAFGAALKKCYDGFSEYDKMNYLIIPLGTWETDTVHGYKSAGIRIRLTETMRFTNSFLQHVVTRAADNDPAASASLGHLFEFGAGQVPGAHPLVKLGFSWGQFAAGHQPRDNFRGSPVVQTADWKAGGWERTKGMLAYTWNDSGLGGMVRFDSKSQNIMEFTASATPVVNRLIRFSDSGLREREERFDKRESETIYKIRSQMPRGVNELLQEYSALQSVGDRRDDRQQVRYKELGVWHLKVWTPTYQEMKIAPPKDWRTYGEGLGIDSEPYQRKNQK